VSCTIEPSAEQLLSGEAPLLHELVQRELHRAEHALMALLHVVGVICSPFHSIGPAISAKRSSTTGSRSSSELTSRKPGSRIQK